MFKVSFSVRLLIILIIVTTVKSECISFNSTICSDVIYSYDSKMIATSQIIASITETLLTSKLGNLTIVGPILFPKCYEAARNFICGNFFPECGSEQQSLKVCRGVCNTFMIECADYLEQFGAKDQLPECSTLPETNCSTVSNAPKLNLDEIVCPPPLIRNPTPEIPRQTCPGNTCCLPCPITQNFMKEGDYDSIYNFFRGIAVSFSVFTVLTLVSYLVIPEKRKFPLNMISSIFFSAFIAFVSFWVFVFYPAKELFCESEVQTASVGHATKACFATGFLFIYGSLSSILWFSCFSINVFLVVILRKDTHRYRYVYHIISWGIPLISVIIASAFGQFGTSLAPICGIPDNRWNMALFHIPTAIFIFPAFLMNIYILFYVMKIAREINKTMLYVMKLQFRPFLFSLYGTFVFVFFWIYLIVVNPQSEKWLQDWFFCVALGNGQNECSKISTPYFQISMIYVAYFIIASYSLVGFCIFCIKKDIINGWAFILAGKTTIFTIKGYTSSKSEKEKHTEKEPEKEKEKDGEIGLENRIAELLPQDIQKNQV